MATSPAEPGLHAQSAQRRRSQEGLDTRIALIPRAHKLLGVGIALVVAAGAVWGFLGTVPSKVKGQGILVRSDQQAFVVNPATSGTVEQIHVAPGDPVEQGQLVATLSLPDLDELVRVARKTFDDSEARYESARTRSDLDVAAQERATEARVAYLRKSVQTTQRQSDRHQELVQAEERLREQGLLNRVAAIEQLERYEATVTRLDDLESQIEIELAELEDVRSIAASALELRHAQVQADQRTLEELEARLDQRRKVRAPNSGRVEELRVAPGENVQLTSTLLTISSGGSGYEALAFLDPSDGSNVVAGQKAHVIPTTVRKAEFGSMRGKIVSVSEEPVSAAEIEVEVRNAELTAMFVEAGPPYASRVELFEDTTNRSGFEWWSGDGPPFPITTGTVVEIEIVVRDQPPVSLVMPAIREFLGL